MSNILLTLAEEREFTRDDYFAVKMKVDDGDCYDFSKELQALGHEVFFANWDDLDIDGYIADHEIIVNPLLSQGYASIGCWPCTRAVGPGEDARAGRWTGFSKTECGLHD